MATKPSYLIHWTGKDINTQLDTLTDNEREEYVFRLKNTLDSGLWMMPNELRDLVSWGDGTELFSSTLITCFTELWLDKSNDHFQRYGLLGFGFDRKWVLERFGSPVYYFRNHENDIYAKALNELRLLKEQYGASIQLNSFLSLIKPMSKYGEDDFINIEDGEWRITLNSHLIKSKLIQQNYEITYPILGRKEALWKIPFTLDDIPVLVLPDEETKIIALDKIKILQRVEDKIKLVSDLEIP